MKIENNSVTPMSSQNTDPTNRVDRKTIASETDPASMKHDRATVSENARLLSKARTAMDVHEVESKRLEMLQQSVQSGDYTVQVEDVARKLVNRMTPGS